MAKKPTNPKETGPAFNESPEENSEVTESLPSNPQMEVSQSQQPSSDPPAESTTPAESPDDLLEDVRQALIAEDQDQQHQATWWQRLTRKNKKAEVEEVDPEIEIDLPMPLDSVDLQSEQISVQEPPEVHAEPIEELIQLLEEEVDETPEPAAQEPQLADQVSEPVIDIDQLKKQAFEPRPLEQGAESLSEVRAVALSDGEEVFVEVHAEPADPLKERVSAFENALRPYRQLIYLTFTFLGIVAVVITSLILWNAYQRSLPPPPTAPPVDVPYPVSVSLPGGWSFSLGVGTLTDGKWQPQGPEWLTGTEVCRWVGLPWSEQLEAVLRTLNQDDPIEVVMSNNDKLTYRVESVREMTPAQMQGLDANSPCLLLILTQQDSENRWVLTALP